MDFGVIKTDVRISNKDVFYYYDKNTIRIPCRIFFNMKTHRLVDMLTR